jgi:diguanylate cyclase (GGDEF)-like protein
MNARPATDFEAAGLRATTTLQSALVCPLMVHDRFIGTICVYHVDASFYRDDHRRLLDRVCEQAAAVIHNSIVFEQAQEDSLTDPLTGLPNTRYMFLHLARELARADRLRTEVSLIVTDLDDFKEINDTFGHHVGDRALREVATALRNTIRPYDICVRYAGDEFIVVLSGCSREEAESQAASSCSRRWTVFSSKSAERANPDHVERRGGGVSARRQCYEALLAAADSRMYRDKSERRTTRSRLRPADASRWTRSRARCKRTTCRLTD